ncbi:hypothetical protein [Streptomyces sp. PvR034]|uniref:hypothetical protein n=1 Tax=Streptomyces sp. PvR034 TaxID=3156401 RepID=UPI003398F28B
MTVTRVYTVMQRAWLDHMDAARHLLSTDVIAWMDATMNAPDANERTVTVQW